MTISIRSCQWRFGGAADAGRVLNGGVDADRSISGIELSRRSARCHIRFLSRQEREVRSEKNYQDCGRHRSHLWPPCPWRHHVLMHPKIRPTASVEASENGEHVGNTLDRLAYLGKVTSSLRFACETRYKGRMFRRSQTLLDDLADSCPIAPQKGGWIEP